MTVTIAAPTTITALVDDHTSVSTEITGTGSDLEATCPVCREALDLGTFGAYLNPAEIGRALNDAFNEHLDDGMNLLGDPSECALAA